MKAPIPSVASHIVGLANYPARLVGHYRNIVSYKTGLSELADMMLNIPCDNQPWEKFADVIAMTFWKWREEQDYQTQNETTYHDWVKFHLRPDLCNKMRMLLNL